MGLETSHAPRARDDRVLHAQVAAQRARGPMRHPCGGGRRVQARMRACSCGVSTVGFDPRCRAARPARPTEASSPDWNAVVRLGVRHLRARIGRTVPLTIMGYSNGGAPALKYALDQIEEPALRRADRLVSISPNRLIEFPPATDCNRQRATGSRAPAKASATGGCGSWSRLSRPPTRSWR